MPRPLATALVVVCCASSGTARATDTATCRNGSFPTQETAFGLASVVGTPRTYLRSDTPPCPDDSAECRGRVYVVPGGIVLTGATNGAYVCAFFPSRNSGSAGAQPSPASVPLAAWNGKWRDGDNSIVLRIDGARLTASGEAYWPSAHPSPKERPGGPNLGDMGGTATPTGNIVVFAGKNSADCRVTLTLLLPFLLAADNMSCGGMNVSFSGVYRKR